MKTLLKWDWTVRALMNRRAPISGLDSPSLASRATWVSWAVNSRGSRGCASELSPRWHGVRWLRRAAKASIPISANMP